MSWAIIRVRGTVNVKDKISKTLKMLRLHRPNHCIIVPENDSYKGMLNIVKDYVTWGEINSDSVELLAKDRIRLEGGEVVTSADLKNSPLLRCLLLPGCPSISSVAGSVVMRASQDVIVGSEL